MFSIRWKLTLSYIFVSITTAVAVGLIAFFLIKGYVERKADEEMKMTARNIEQQIAPLMQERRLMEMDSLALALGITNDIRIRILDTQRRPVLDTSELLKMRNENQYMRMRGGPDFSFEPGGRMLTVPVERGGGVEGYIELHNPPSIADRTLSRSRIYLLFAGLAAVAAAAVLGLYMGKRLTSPLLVLSDTVAKMKSGNLSIRARFDRNDEIGYLSERFNEMADRLEESFSTLERERDTLKAFAEDASHELRSPVTALQTFTELLLGNSGKDPQKRDEFLRDSKRQLDRLQWIVHGLLNLTRFDAELVELNYTDTDVNDLLRETVQTFAGEIDAKELEVQATVHQPQLSVHCDRQRLQTALSNIVGNAVKYSPRKGYIHIEATKATDGVDIVVTDNGPGIAGKDLPHIFNRFYRAGNEIHSGSGLGLAISDSIVKAHKGVIVAESLPESGSRFTVHLPFLQS